MIVMFEQVEHPSASLHLGNISASCPVLFQHGGCLVIMHCIVTGDVKEKSTQDLMKFALLSSVLSGQLQTEQY